MSGKDNLFEEILNKALLKGNFILKSGKISNYYIDKYLFESDISLLDKITDLMIEKIPEDIDRIAGMELGGIPLATILSYKLKKPLLFIRKERKEYGTKKIIEGTYFKGDKIILIEDVVTSGSTIVEAINNIREEGLIIEDVLCVIDRDKGAGDKLKKLRVNFHYLFKLKNLF